MSIFEAAMLLCFGLAWPFSIFRSYHSKTAKGKSGFFTAVILIGYVCGIINKIFYHYDFVLYLYILNFLMVLVDFLLYFRNKRFDTARQQYENFGS